MKYSELCAISGMSGLYQLVTTKSDGAIVRSLDDNTTKFVAARSHNVTPLDSIEVYTQTDNVRLWDVFQEFKKNDDVLTDFDASKADNKAIVTTFTKLLPTFDKDKVYVSDMKKMIKWYSILKKMDMLQEELQETDEEK